MNPVLEFHKVRAFALVNDSCSFICLGGCGVTGYIYAVGTLVSAARNLSAESVALGGSEASGD